MASSLYKPWPPAPPPRPPHPRDSLRLPDAKAELSRAVPRRSPRPSFRTLASSVAATPPFDHTAESYAPPPEPYGVQGQHVHGL